MSDDAKAVAFLEKWTSDNVGRVYRSSDVEEAKRLARACLQAGYQQGIPGEQLIAACARLSQGRLYAYMLKHLEDFPFADYLKGADHAPRP